MVPPATQLGCVQPLDRERRGGDLESVTVDGVGGDGGGKLGSWVALEVAWAGVGAKVVDAVWTPRLVAAGSELDAKLEPKAAAAAARRGIGPPKLGLSSSTSEVRAFLLRAPATTRARSAGGVRASPSSRCRCAGGCPSSSSIEDRGRGRVLARTMFVCKGGRRRRKRRKIQNNMQP